MDYFLGLDFGTSGARAIAINSAQDIVAQARVHPRENSSHYLSTCWQTQLEELLVQIPLKIRQGLSRIAIDGTSGTVLLCDHEGKPIGSPLWYNDDQARIVIQDLKELVPPGHGVISASSSLAKLLWFQRQFNFDQARYFLHQADWLGFLLHGQLGWSDDHNVLKLGYDPALADYPAWFQRPPLSKLLPLLPRVLVPGTPVGRITQAAADRWQINSACQICAGTTDSIAAFLATGAAGLGTGVTSLGSTLVLKLISNLPIQASAHGIYSHRCGNYWLVGGASNCGGAILSQFFSPQELAHLSTQIDPSVPSPYDYYPLPQAGERFPINDPDLQPRLEPRPDDPVEFLHGLLESLARIEAQGYELLRQLGASPVDRVMTAGGGAQNQAWNKIRARVLGVPVQPSPHPEAAYGAALLAFRGLSPYRV